MTSTTLSTKSNSSAMLRAVAVLVLASELPLGAFARHCWIDNNGFEHCSSLSNGARIGIGVGIAVAFFLLFCLLAMARRRRPQQYYRTYLTQQPQQPQQYGQQPAYGGAYRPQQGYGAPNPQGYNPQEYNQYSAPPGPPPPGYNEPQAPGHAYQGSKV